MIFDIRSTYAQRWTAEDPQGGRLPRLAVERGRGFSYTQSAVSQQIAALEAEAGMTLLERHSRGVSLTAAGQTLLGHAEGILAQLDAAEAAL